VVKTDEKRAISFSGQKSPNHRFKPKSCPTKMVFVDASTIGSSKVLIVFSSVTRYPERIRKDLRAYPTCDFSLILSEGPPFLEIQGGPDLSLVKQ
jgi:hypothetical protein